MEYTEVLTFEAAVVVLALVGLVGYWIAVRRR